MMRGDQQQIGDGARVVYAEGLYEVVAVHGDLVTLRGVAVGRSVREGCTVLMSDVRVPCRAALASAASAQGGEG